MSFYNYNTQTNISLKEASILKTGKKEKSKIITPFFFCRTVRSWYWILNSSWSKFLFLEFELINAEEIIQLQCHHFVTSNEIMNQCKWFSVATEGETLIGHFIMHERDCDTWAQQWFLTWQKKKTWLHEPPDVMQWEHTTLPVQHSCNSNKIKPESDQISL